MSVKKQPMNDDVFKTVESVLGQVKGEADVRHISERSLMLRFANSRTYQPQAEFVDRLSLRVVSDGGRIGTATTTDLSPQGLAMLVKRATEIARHALPTRSFPGFPDDPHGSTRAVDAASDILGSHTDERAGEFSAAMDLIEEGIEDNRVAGVYNESASTLSVANTSGLRRSSARTVAYASILVENLGFTPNVSGWSEVASWDPSKVNLVALAEEALERTPERSAKLLRPGTYRVLLGGPAIAELMNMLSYGGLGAYSVEEGWSFLSDAEGKQVASPQVTVYDDPSSPLGLPLAIDYDGMPSEKRFVFDHGVAGGPAHDILTAARVGAKSTANALPPEAPYGPFGPLPSHLTFEHGDCEREELVRELKTGILVTRLHYVRFVNRKKTIVTGMTRDGTYWVENGEVKYPVTNLRVTDSILEVLKGTELVGRDLRCCSDGFFAPVVPDLITRSVAFNSATTF